MQRLDEACFGTKFAGGRCITVNGSMANTG